MSDRFKDNGISLDTQYNVVFGEYLKSEYNNTRKKINGYSVYVSKGNYSSYKEYYVLDTPVELPNGQVVYKIICDMSISSCNTLTSSSPDVTLCGTYKGNDIGYQLYLYVLKREGCLSQFYSQSRGAKILWGKLGMTPGVQAYYYHEDRYIPIDSLKDRELYLEGHDIYDSNNNSGVVLVYQGNELPEKRPEDDDTFDSDSRPWLKKKISNILRKLEHWIWDINYEYFRK